MATDQVPKFIRTPQFQELLAAHQSDGSGGDDANMSSTVNNLSGLAAPAVKPSLSTRASHDRSPKASPKPS